MTDALERGPDGRSTDLPSGLGPPAWLAATLNHCTNCGGPLALGPVAGRGARTGSPARPAATSPTSTRASSSRRFRSPSGRGDPDPPGLRARARAVGAAGRFPRGRRDADRGRDPRDARGDRARSWRRGRSSGCTRGSRRPSSCSPTRPGSSAARCGRARRRSRSGAFAPEAIPWPEIAFQTTYWALVDWLARAPAGPARRRAGPVETGAG